MASSQALHATHLPRQFRRLPRSPPTPHDSPQPAPLTLFTFFLLFSFGRGSSDRRSGLLKQQPVFASHIAEEIAVIDDGEIERVPCLCFAPLLLTHLHVPIPLPLLRPLPHPTPRPPHLLPMPTDVAPMLQIAPTEFYSYICDVSLRKCEIVT